MQESDFLRQVHKIARSIFFLDSEEELWRRSTSLDQRNLHVIFTMNPSEGDCKNRSTHSPALFNRCVVDWFGTWGSKATAKMILWLDIGKLFGYLSLLNLEIYGTHQFKQGG
jgi:hypothetical protein